MNFVAEEKPACVYPAQRSEATGESAGTGFAQRPAAGAEVNLRLSGHHSPNHADVLVDPKRSTLVDCRPERPLLHHGATYKDLYGPIGVHLARLWAVIDLSLWR